MINNVVEIPVILILTLILANHGLSEDNRRIEMKLSVFPETVAIGDTCYALVTAFNHSTEIAGVFEPVFKFAYFDDAVQFNLSHHDKTWRGAFESLIYEEPVRLTQNVFAIPSGESVAFLAVPLQFPPLEDLYQDKFWTEIQKKLKENPDGLSFDFGIEFASPRVAGEPYSKRARLTQEVKIKLRNDKEMAMIDQWYRNTPKALFPKFVQGEHLLKVTPQKLLFRSSKKILGHEPWCFIPISNRFPGDPNNPTTWQDWQDLEESIVPSTMRDEIRLTRILIQYCDTKDDTVLRELKDWFDGMNEVQRPVMAKSIRDRAAFTYSVFPTPPVYKAIREYDVIPIPENRKKYLRVIGLIE